MRSDHRQHHHAPGGSVRHPDAVAAFRSAAAGAGAAIHLAACPCHAGDVELCDLIIGSITMPLAVVCVILMQLLPSEVRPLVPALQSTWLHVHVTLAMLSYAACALSCALAMMFLIQDNFQT